MAGGKPCVQERKRRRRNPPLLQKNWTAELSLTYQYTHTDNLDFVELARARNDYQAVVDDGRL